MNKKSYAGIGSRKTPADVLKTMEELGTALATQGFCLRSGNCKGADQAFQNGASGLVELYLPWKGYEKQSACHQIYLPTKQAYDIAKKFHPAWENCSGTARAFHARNAQIVLGENLDNPVEFLLCWTPKGKKIGGTAMGISIAEFYDIPVHNLALPASQNFVNQVLQTQELSQQLSFDF